MDQAQQLQNELILTKARAFDKIALLEDQILKSNNVLTQQSDLIIKVVAELDIPEGKQNDPEQIMIALRDLKILAAIEEEGGKKKKA